MDNCPAEVLHQICAFLEPKDVANFRLATKTFGSVGAHYIMGSGLVRFHCSPASLEVVESISKHPVIRQYVRKIRYEANLLCGIFNSREYKSTFYPGHPTGPPPIKPEAGSSTRERRLYERNLQKWRQGDSESPSGKRLEKLFKEYCEVYETQQSTVQSNADIRILKAAIARFPKLTEIALSNTGRCRHALSARFFARFPDGFQPPMQYESQYTVRQLNSLLSPMSKGPSNLQTLIASAVSPKIFSKSPIRDNMIACFAKLKKLHLTLRLEEFDSEELEYMDIKELYRPITNGSLREVIAKARLLEELCISFNDYGEYQGCCADIKDIFGDCVWPRLKSLSLSSLICKADDFLECLKRQPRLHHLGLSLTTLTSGSWAELLQQMRKQLKLKSTEFSAFLASRGVADEFMIMDHVDADAFFDDPECITTLAENIEMYLCWTDEDEDDPDDCMNPARRLGDYVPEEELMDESLSDFGSELMMDLDHLH